MRSLFSVLVKVSVLGCHSKNTESAGFELLFLLFHFAWAGDFLHWWCSFISKVAFDVIFPRDGDSDSGNVGSSDLVTTAD